MIVSSPILKTGVDWFLDLLNISTTMSFVYYHCACVVHVRGWGGAWVELVVVKVKGCEAEVRVKHHLSTLHAVFSPAFSNASLPTNRLPNHLKENGAVVHDGVDVLRHVQR